MRKHGHMVIDPWEGGEVTSEDFKKVEEIPHPEKMSELKRLNHRIGDANRRSIEGVEVVVAVLDGSDVDSGTASEIGFAFARGKTIFGYRGDIRLSGENEATVVNLQVQYWIEESGGGEGKMVRNIPDLLCALDSHS